MAKHRTLPKRPRFPRVPKRRSDMSYRKRIALHKARERNNERQDGS